MKEWLLTGTLLALLSFGDDGAPGRICETECRGVPTTEGSDGFVPRERIAAPPANTPAQETPLLPDYGSEAYL